MVDEHRRRIRPNEHRHRRTRRRCEASACSGVWIAARAEERGGLHGVEQRGAYLTAITTARAQGRQSARARSQVHLWGNPENCCSHSAELNSGAFASGTVHGGERAESAIVGKAQCSACIRRRNTTTVHNLRT